MARRANRLQINLAPQPLPWNGSRSGHPPSADEVIGPPADVPVHVFSIATPARLAPIRAGKWRVESGCDGKGSGDNREEKDKGPVN